MKYTLRKKKPVNGQIIVFKASQAFYPEIGVWQISENDIEEVYIPANDDRESIKNIEWWMEIPK